VLNLTTGAITPQFHVVFDDWFSTVSTTGAAPDLDSDVWMKLFGESRFQYVQDDDELDEYEESEPIDTKRQMRVSRQ
jgi:hypothetical protein